VASAILHADGCDEADQALEVNQRGLDYGAFERFAFSAA
jgi:hypothetical protein